MFTKQLSKTLIVCTALVALALAAPQAAKACGGGVICVDADAGGAATGLSWTDAYTNVQDALTVAAPGNEIWVAEGIYYPDEGAGQTDDAPGSTFALRPGVEIYGGFDGTEITRAMRDPAAHRTLLSGDIDQNDVTDADGMVTNVEDINGDNAYHVLTGNGVIATARLDGFIVTAGHASGDDDADCYGGGMTNDSGSPTLNAIFFSGNYADYGGGGMYNRFSAPTLISVTISNSQVDYGDGAGMYNEQSNPSLDHVVFNGNRTPSYGGGMYNDDSDPTLTDVAFNDGLAAINGGGMYNLNSHPTMTNTVFNNNVSDGGGGGMFNNLSNPRLVKVTFKGNQAGDSEFLGGGGMFNEQSHPILTDVAFIENQSPTTGGGMVNYNSNPVLTNVTFIANQGDPGGGMSNFNSSTTLTNALFSGNRAGIGSGIYNGNSTSTLINVTFSGNWAEYAGGGVFNENSTSILTHCLLWGNDTGDEEGQIYDYDGSSSDVTYSLIQGGYAGTGNLALDPQFVAPVAATAAPTTTGDYRLRNNSPAIDAGDPTTCPATDLRGEPRDDLRCDIGAYEYTLTDGDTIVKSDFTGGVPYSFGPTRVGVTFSGANSSAITVTKHLTYPGGSRDSGEIKITWWIDAGLTSGFPITLSLCYTDADVDGLDESALSAFRWDGAQWTTPISTGLTVFTNTNCVQMTGIESLSAWTLKDTSAGNVRPNAIKLHNARPQTAAEIAWGGAILALGAASCGATCFGRKRRP
ncbi:MAG: hypothetical protein JXA21_06015 [Anaerolineae bacterium]|nr:hypothetical protein [Anaerolineae bacterium]